MVHSVSASQGLQHWDTPRTLVSLPAAGCSAVVGLFSEPSVEEKQSPQGVPVQAGREGVGIILIAAMMTDCHGPAGHCREGWLAFLFLLFLMLEVPEDVRLRMYWPSLPWEEVATATVVPSCSWLWKAHNFSTWQPACVNHLAWCGALWVAFEE